MKIETGDRLTLVPPDSDCESITGTIVRFNVNFITILWDEHVEGYPDFTDTSIVRISRMIERGGAVITRGGLK